MIDTENYWVLLMIINHKFLMLTYSFKYILDIEDDLGRDLN